MGSHVPIAPGTRFNRLTIIGLAPRGPRGDIRYRCRCDCGKVIETYLFELKKKKHGTKSCGCLRRDSLTVHGYSKPARPEYNAWRDMIRRCHKSYDQDFHNYGGRGIVVCDRWRQSFASFIEDMGDRPPGKLCIERLDNNGHYEPGNCVWATYKEQNRNTRRNRWVTIRGETRCLSDWASYLGIDKTTLKNRLDKGWDEAALLLPSQGNAIRGGHVMLLVHEETKVEEIRASPDGPVIGTFRQTTRRYQAPLLGPVRRQLLQRMAQTAHESNDVRCLDGLRRQIEAGEAN